MRKKVGIVFGWKRLLDKIVCPENCFAIFFWIKNTLFQRIMEEKHPCSDRKIHVNCQIHAMSKTCPKEIQCFVPMRLSCKLRLHEICE